MFLFEFAKKFVVGFVDTAKHSLKPENLGGTLFNVTLLVGATRLISGPRVIKAVMPTPDVPDLPFGTPLASVDAAVDAIDAIPDFGGMPEQPVHNLHS